MINSNETVLEVRDLTYKYHNGTVAIENINMQKYNFFIPKYIISN